MKYNEDLIEWRTVTRMRPKIATEAYSSHSGTVLECILELMVSGWIKY
jgi:hypothetical protein